MKRDISPRGLDLVKSFEGFRAWVYDDFDPREHEWHGGPVHGTLTIGYGHTNAARHPLRCKLGTRITEAQATEVLHVDLSECIEQVNRMVKVPVSQGQFDALVSFTFNCGVGNLRRLIIPLNAGHYDQTRGDFFHYVRSKGQIMGGLERRRRAEVHLWDDNYGDVYETQPKPPPHEEPQPEPDARPEPPAPPPTPPLVHGVAAGAIVAGAADAASQVSTVASNVQGAHDNVMSIVKSVISSPETWLAILACAGIAYLWWRFHQQSAPPPPPPKAS